MGSKREETGINNPGGRGAFSSVRESQRNATPSREDIGGKGKGGGKEAGVEKRAYSLTSSLATEATFKK